tara:strand:+ start:4991 stop:5500 length:510 start_codon:yes stop_codon:yes gene_type:complete
MNSDLTFSRQSDFSFFHVRGGGAAADLEGLYGDLPSRWFRYKLLPTGGFLARLGDREFYVFGPDGTLPSKFIYGVETYVFQRNDAVFSFDGDGYPSFLRELCAYDFETIEPDEFILANLAGVSCWFKVPPKHSTQVLIGCEPSYEHYMNETLTEVLSEFLSAQRRKEET